MLVLMSALISFGIPKVPDVAKGNPEDITKFVAKVDTATAMTKGLLSSTLENVITTGESLMNLESIGQDQKEALSKENDKAKAMLEKLGSVDISQPDSLAAAIKEGKAVAAEYLGLITSNLSAEGAAQAIAQQKDAVMQLGEKVKTDVTTIVNKSQEAVSLAPAAAKAKTLGAAKGLKLTTFSGNTLDESSITAVVDKGVGFAKDIASWNKDLGDLVKNYADAINSVK